MPKPGQSKKGFGKGPDTEGILGFALTTGARISIIQDGDLDQPEPDLVLGTMQIGRYGGSMVNLTRMTEEELLTTKKLLDRAFELALPVVQRRDKEANDAYENQGDDSNPRLYRGIPQLVYREGAITEYCESIHGRPADFSRSDSDG